MEGRYSKISLGNNQYLHYKNFAEAFSDDYENGFMESKIYKIYSACNLTINGQDKIIIGDYVDIIRFAIDDLSPVTRIENDIDRSGNENWINFTNNITTDWLSLRLKNIDDYPSLIDVNGSGYNMAFGPNKTFYCLSRRNVECTEFIEYDYLSETNEIVLDYTIENSPNYTRYRPYPQLCYYSTDNGGNIEDQECILLKISNTKFDEPNITIIPN
jgi:hypothetical protein